MSAPVLFSARNNLNSAITKNKFVHCHIVKERLRSNNFDNRFVLITKNKFVHCHIVKERLRTETDKIHNAFENSPER